MHPIVTHDLAKIINAAEYGLVSALNIDGLRLLVAAEIVYKTMC